MRIKKTSQYINGGASLSNVYGTSNENGYTQEYINNLNTYSTDEVRIGTYLGKPLYRKVITGTLDTSGSMDIATLTNCDVLVNIKGSIVSPSSYKIPFPFYNSATSFLSSALSSINHIYVYFSSNFNSSTYKIVIEYTKTTD